MVITKTEIDEIKKYIKEYLPTKAFKLISDLIAEFNKLQKSHKAQNSRIERQNKTVSELQFQLKEYDEINEERGNLEDDREAFQKHYEIG